jgi:hypothetical protein
MGANRIEANESLGDKSGLAPWWVCRNGTVKRYVFDVPTSQKYWMHWVKEQRLLYRLALDQPNQEDLVDLLSRRTDLDPKTIREAVVNLSPWFRKTI